jgi:hypothetical protein
VFLQGLAAAAVAVILRPAGSLPAPMGRARGGSVRPGAIYLVGESGPETFILTGRGYVIPNAVRA